MKALQVKVQLSGFKPSVYRTFLVPKDTTFYDLHSYIQDWFWFMDYHLWIFDHNKGDIWISTEFEIKSSPSFFWPSKDFIAEKTKLKEVFSDELKSLTYWYDFWDDWIFSVKLEKEVELEKEEILPKILRWKWGLLIEDCGWPWWLAEMLEMYENKKFNKNVFDSFKGFELYLSEFLDFDLDDIEFEDPKERFKNYLERMKNTL